MRTLDLIRFITVICTAISLAAGLAHLLAMPHKMQLGRDDYFTVQQIYAGWALLGIAILLALGGSIWLAIASRHRGDFPWAVTAAACLAAGLVVFFFAQFPANQATKNWTTIPANWEVLRRRWEWGHAVDAALYFVALSALTISLLVGRAPRVG